MTTQQEPEASPTDWIADHVRRYVESDGEDGHMMNGVPCLLITTRGQKSGKLRRTPVAYGQDGDRYVVIASRAGSDHHPAWYLNLEAQPEAEIQVLAQTHRVRARVVEGEERERLWQMMVDTFADVDDYQKKTSRKIPLIVLEPV